MIFGNNTNTTCRFSFKQYNLFYTVHKHEILAFMETVPHGSIIYNTEITMQVSLHRILLFHLVYIHKCRPQKLLKNKDTKNKN